MRCIFCRSQLHTKSNCSNPFTREKEESILACFQTSYIASQRLNLTRAEFNESMNIILNHKYRVIEIKMAIECVKKRTGERFNIKSNKNNLIRILTDSVCVIFNYTFLPPSTEHIANRITVGISQLTREILHTRVGNLQPLIINRPSQYQELEQIHRTYTPDNSNSGYRRDYQASHLPLLPLQNLHTSYTVHKAVKKFDELAECAICLQAFTDDTYVYFECLHEFCKNCVNTCLSKNLFNCSLCRSPITKIYTQYKL